MDGSSSKPRWETFAWPGRGVGLPKGRSCSPLGATGDRDAEKILFATRCEATTSQGRLYCVCIRLYLYPSICVYVCLFLGGLWDGAGWKRVAGRSRRTTPEGREGRIRPCAAQARMGGRVSRSVPRPPHSPGRPESVPAAVGYMPRCSRASCQSAKPLLVRGGGVCLQRACLCRGALSPFFLPCHPS